MRMRIALSDADRMRLADWLADLAPDRTPHAVDALADGRHARVTRDEDGRLTYEGRVVLVMPEGAQDLLVSVRQGVVNTRPWRPATTRPDSPSARPPSPRGRRHHEYAYA